MKIDPARQPETEHAGGVPQGVRVLAFLCGILVCWLGFKSARQDWRRIDTLVHLDRLSPASGKFLRVNVRKDTLASGEDWYPDVLYDYSVAGQSIWGWRLSFEEEPRPKAYWEERLKGYAPGAPVTVYFDPAAPKESIIEKKHDGLFRVWMKLGLGAGFLLVGLMLSGLSLSGWFRK
ncbi:MAG: DUF3592 domain-containing protein [Fibrobacteres bacterium]|nr:DUF3592 domain-containing protein [Fibrobacterota bacterium]